MSKTDIELIKTTIIIPAGRSGRNDVMIPLYDTNQLLTCMTAAREDERERIRLMITNEIFFLSDMADSKDRWAANRLNKLFKAITPCT